MHKVFRGQCPAYRVNDMFRRNLEQPLVKQHCCVMRFILCWTYTVKHSNVDILSSFTDPYFTVRTETSYSVMLNIMSHEPTQSVKCDCASPVFIQNSKVSSVFPQFRAVQS